MEKKNTDYGKDDDAFANFRAFGKYGILVRLSDKLQRLVNFQDKGEFAVVDEKEMDTALDALNYIVLYMAYK